MSRFLLVTADPAYDHFFRAAVQGRLPGDIQTVLDPTLPATPDELLGRSVGEVPSVVLLGPGVDVHEAMRLREGILHGGAHRKASPGLIKPRAIISSRKLGR